MADNKQNYSFQAEIKQLLDILTHSLYTHRDVFIRELVSNAADALDKVRFRSLKGEKVADPDLELKIKITLDKDKKTFTISDSGIGMSKDELINNLGTIAHSGTSDFLKQLKPEKGADINLIGKFGVGFYSVFMAGKQVEVVTKSALEDKALIWRSEGTGTFEIEEAAEQKQRGTSITVFLRDDAEEFTDNYTVKSIVEKYSNFVPFQIFVEDEQVNKITAIWREPKTSVKEDQYNEFYKFIAKQTENPLTWMHLTADAPLSFHSLLFIPSANLELFGFEREAEGIQLFVKRVLIDAHADNILPPYLRFVRGVLESDDLPLNISRETLQENPYMFKLKSVVVSKFLSFLQDLSKEPEKYHKFWQEHGRILKEGYNDYTQKEKIADLFRFNSSKCADADELISLETYTDRMQKDQEHIYYLSGADRESIEKNPTMEIFRAKDIEVLYCYDPIDEFALPGLIEYKKKTFLSADQADMEKLAKIPSEQKKEEPPKDSKGLDNLARRMKDILGNRVEDVVVSQRLVDSPAVLVAANKNISAQMEKIMQLYNKSAAHAKRIMEINGKHTLIQQLLKIYEKDVNDPVLSKIVNGLFQSVLILDGTLVDPHRMAAGIQDVLAETTRLYIENIGVPIEKEVIVPKKAKPETENKPPKEESAPEKAEPTTAKVTPKQAKPKTEKKPPKQKKPKKD
ncbi:molecular chaperone HtpG [candidate division KSB1 bacterium]|nr:molecular chaperone HtpG [candidate division KSB1 bacterium]